MCDASLTDFDTDILSSTTLNNEISSEQAQKSTRRRKRGEDYTPIDSISENSSQNSTTDIPPQKKAKTAPVPKKKRERRLRPDDQRALNILCDKFRSTSKGALCQVDNCSKTMKSVKPSNLKRHLSNVHPEVFARLFPNLVNKKKQAELEAFNAAQDAIELVTVNGYPFYMLEAPAMRGFIQARLNAVQPEGYSFSINRHDIVQQISDESNRVRERIKSELKGKMVSLTFDVCTIATFSVIGVDALVMGDQNAKKRSLGIIKINERHTSVQLANMLFDILADFDIPLQNVFSITCDTASNATATADILNLVINSCRDTDEDIDQNSLSILYH